MGKGKPRWPEEQPEEQEDSPPWPVPQQWLEKPASIAAVDEEIQALAEHLDRFWKGNVPKQAGAKVVAWRAFRARFTEGDEIWWFRSPQEDWDQLMGLAGYALVREGKPVDAIVTMLN